MCSGVVEGECGGTLFPQTFFEKKNAIPPNDISTRGNSDTCCCSVPPNRLAENCKVYGKS